MVRIGSHQISSKVILAPMAGVTSDGYRKFMERFGVEITYTEMVSDMGLIYGNEETKSYVRFEKGSSLVGLQLFGSSPIHLAEAAKIALAMNPNIDFFDVNMACPVPKVTKTGAGSALLKNPALCGEIIKAIREATGLPVTAKIRLGWDEKHMNYPEVIEALEKAGVTLIALHARTTKDLYMGEPRYQEIIGLQDKMSVPLCISGNIFSLEEAKKALEMTHAEMVMVARGGMGNPTLIQEINHYYASKEEVKKSNLEQQCKYCLDLAEFLIREKGEEKAMRIYRSIAPKFFNGFPNAKAIKTELSGKLTTYRSLEEIIQNNLKSMSDNQ